MNIREALQALAEGQKIQRPGSWVLELQDATVALYSQELVEGYSCRVDGNKWLFVKFPLIADHPANYQNAAAEVGAIGAPYAFVPEDMYSEDWSIIE